MIFTNKKIKKCYKQSEKYKLDPTESNKKRVRQTSERLLNEFAIKQGIEEYKMLPNGDFFFLDKDKSQITESDIETNTNFKFEDILIDLEFRTEKHIIFNYYDYLLENENQNYLLTYQEFLKWKS